MNVRLMSLKVDLYKEKDGMKVKVPSGTMVYVTPAPEAGWSLIMESVASKPFAKGREGYEFAETVMIKI